MIRKGLIGILVLCSCVIGMGALTTSAASAARVEKCTKLFPEFLTLTFYKDAECKTAEKSGAFHKLVLQKPIRPRLFRRGIQRFRGTIFSTTYNIECSSVTNSGGSLENFEESGVAKVRGKETKLKYSGCTVPEPSGCKVSGGGFQTNSLKSLGSTESGVSKFKFEPEAGAGTAVATVAITECVLETNLVVKGSFTGVVPSGAESLLEFTATSGSALTVGASPFTYTGTTENEEEETSELLFYGA
jgi:hypothetical protein